MSKEYQLARKVLDVLEHLEETESLLKVTHQRLMYIYLQYTQFREDAHVDIRQLEHLHAALCRPESTEEEA